MMKTDEQMRNQKVICFLLPTSILIGSPGNVYYQLWLVDKGKEQFSCRNLSAKLLYYCTFQGGSYVVFLLAVKVSALVMLVHFVCVIIY